MTVWCGVRSYIGCGGKDGSVTLIELGNTLSKIIPNEKPMTNAVRVTLLCFCLSSFMYVFLPMWALALSMIRSKSYILATLFRFYSDIQTDCA